MLKTALETLSDLVWAFVSTRYRTSPTWRNRFGRIRGGGGGGGSRERRRITGENEDKLE